MEVIGKFSPPILTREEIETLLPSAYANSVLKCVRVTSQDDFESFNLLCVTREQFLIEFRQKGTIARTAKLPKECWSENHETLNIHKFVSSSGEWLAVLHSTEQRTCHVYTSRPKSLELKAVKSNVTSLKIDDFWRIGSQQLQFEFGANETGSSIVTDFNSERQPQPPPIEKSVEEIAEPVKKAMKVQTERFAGLLKEATDEMNLYKAAFEAECNRLAADAAGQELIQEKQLLSAVLGPSRVVASAANGDKTTRRKDGFLHLRTFKRFAFRQKLVCFYELVNAQEEELKVRQVSLFSQGFGGATNPPSKIYLDYKTQVLSHDLVFPENLSGKSDENYAEVLLRQIINDEERHQFECEEKEIHFLPPNRSLWVVQTIRSVSRKQTFVVRSVLSLSLVGSGSEEEVTRVQVPEFEFPAAAKSLQLHSHFTLGDLICLMGVFSIKRRLRLTSVMSSLNPPLLTTVLQKKEMGMQLFEEAAVEEFASSFKILHRLSNSDEDGVIIVLPEDKLLGRGAQKSVDIVIYAECDNAAKQFVVDLYSHLSDDVQISLRGADNLRDKASTSTAADIERKEAALSVELLALSDLLDLRLRPGGADNAKEQKKKVVDKDLQTEEAEKSLGADVAIPGHEFLKLRQTLNQLEIETDSAFLI